MRKLCWTLNHATEGIGREYPQHQQMSAGYDYDAPNSVHRLPDDSLPDFEPNFDTAVIHGHARLTDLLSSAPIRNTGFLLNDRLRAVFRQFSLPPHRFYPVPIIYRRKAIEGYYWLQLPEPPVPLAEDASVEVLEEVIASDQQLASLDMLRLYRPARFAYCFLSDPLRLAMESAKITGVRFGTSKLFRQASAASPTWPHVAAKSDRRDGRAR
jgi:hypothetical protein